MDGDTLRDRFDHLLEVWHTGLVMSRELLQEMLDLAPEDATFLALPNAADLGVNDIEGFLANSYDIHDRHRHALDSDCFIEAIAIRVQHIELWLRMYWVRENSGGGVYSPQDKRTFGVIINECAAIGLPQDLEKDLRAFNDVRIDAVHKYLLGDTDYQQLKAAAVAFEQLDSRTVDFVMSKISRPATVNDLMAGRGAIVMAPVAVGRHA